MFRTTFLLPATTIALLACGGQAGTPAPAEPDTGAAERKIYIDPETGERLPGPPPSEQPKPASQTSETQRQPEIIQREDGSTAIIHRPEDWPELKAEKQPDGSLSIGHGGENKP